MNLFLSLLAILIMQFVALTPLRRLNYSTIFVLINTPGALLLTSGISYYFVTTIFKNFTHRYILAFSIALIFEFILLYLTAYNFINKSTHLNLNISQVKLYYKEMTSILSIGAIIFIVFLNLNLKISYLSSFSILTQNLMIINQDLFSYSDSIDGVARKGQFYPWASFILPTVAVNYFFITSEAANVFFLIFHITFAYIILIYILAKLLGVPNFIFYLPLIFIMNIFPLSYILYLPLSFTYSIIASIAAINLILILYIYQTKISRISTVLLISLVLFSIHPASVVTFWILLISILLIYSDLFNLNLKYTFKGFNILIFFSLTFSLILIYAVITLSQRFSLIGGFLARQPNHTDLVSFLIDKPVWERIIPYFWVNVLTLSHFYISIPIFILLLLVMYYSYFKIKKSIFYFIPFFVYLYLISSASISGISGLISIITIPTIPYYQSPIRLSHIGVIIYMLYFFRFAFDFQIKNKEKIIKK